MAQRADNSRFHPEGIFIERALEFRDANTRVIDSEQEFYEFFTPKNSGKPEIHGGFALAHWNGST